MEENINNIELQNSVVRLIVRMIFFSVKIAKKSLNN